MRYVYHIVINEKLDDFGFIMNEGKGEDICICELNFAMRGKLDPQVELTYTLDSKPVEGSAEVVNVLLHNSCRDLVYFLVDLV